MPEPLECGGVVEEMVLSSEQSEGEGLPCPRCDSRETKFCYFNNYSTTQPRHFCRNCKRYWTAGGTLRNVPIGGGLRKNKKSKLSKHGKDLLSASTDESLSPGNHTSLLIASPSSSADGIVDETPAKPVVPLLAYRPSFDTEAGALGTGDCHPFSSSSFEYMNVRNFANRNDALLAEGHEQHAQDANYGFRQPQFAFGCVDQAQSSIGEISSEPSQAGGKAIGPPAMYPRYSFLHRNEQQANGTYTGFRQNFNEFAYAIKPGNLQCSAEKHTLAHNGNPRKRSLTEDEDEGLGNVINVRYPYDWEQVSEVLFGGTPDFFHMPTF